MVLRNSIIIAFFLGFALYGSLARGVEQMVNEDGMSLLYAGGSPGELKVVLGYLD